MSSAPNPNFLERLEGEHARCLVIAEAGVNHNGDLDLARRLIDIATEAGADVVKFQTFKADRLASAAAGKADYQKRTTQADETQHAMLSRLELDEDAHRILVEHCRQRGVVFMSSPFDEQSADLLDALDVPAFKIPSGELTNHPYLEHIARLRRPMIVSTGMATFGEVEAAIEVIEKTGPVPLAVLHCTSQYPAPWNELNLRAMSTLTSLGHPVGYSDHTQGIEIPLAAVALGARIIEKHFTVDRTLPGPDHEASLEPNELAAMVRGIRNIEAALGDGRKRPMPCELETRQLGRKSLAAARDLSAGECLEAEMLIALRPGTGLPPSRRSEVLGRPLGCAVRAGTLLRLDHLAPSA